jgi:hypothetical protein
MICVEKIELGYLKEKIAARLFQTSPWYEE